MSGYERIEERLTEYGAIRFLVTERGIKYTHHECERRLDGAIRGMMRWFSRTLRTATVWNDADMRRSELERMRWKLGEITTYVEVVQRELDRIEGVNKVAERIEKLRNVAGRNPEEAELFLAKAAELEAQQ